eukprot:937338-Amphidinium_carterae.1
MSNLYIHDNFFAGTVAESLPLSYTSTSLAEMAQYPGLYPCSALLASLRSPRTLPAVLSRLSH